MFIPRRLRRRGISCLALFPKNAYNWSFVINNLFFFAMSKIQIHPLGDRVVVAPVSELERGTKTAAGIFIPETVSKERPEQGVIVAVGPGKMNDEGKVIPLSVKIGQTVLFTKYGPDEVKIEDKEYFILSESNILAVIG